MTVDLSKLNPGDTVKFRNGETDVVHNWVAYMPFTGMRISFGEDISAYALDGRMLKGQDSNWDIVEIIPARKEHEMKSVELQSGETLPELEPGEYRLTVKPKPRTLADAIAELKPADGDILELSDGTEFARVQRMTDVFILDFEHDVYDRSFLREVVFHLFPAPPGLRIRKPVPKKVTVADWFVKTSYCRFINTHGPAANLWVLFKGEQESEMRKIAAIEQTDEIYMIPGSEREVEQ